MSDILSFSALCDENITRKDYSASLTEEALRVGLWTEDDVTSLRAELMNALADVIGYYTENQSSSVKTETARKLSLSMMYNIDTYLLSLGNHELALATLKERRAIESYGKGFLINKKHYENAKHLYGKARFTRLNNAGEAYERTIDKHFRYYLTDYNPMFSAQDKVYITLRKFGINGAFHIDEAVTVLEKLLQINEGTTADVVLSNENAKEL